MDEKIMKRIGEAWSRDIKRAPRTRWWESRAIMRHIAAKILQEESDGSYWGSAVLSKTGRKFEKAVSIGCGNAFKEIGILKSGLVEHFDLFELSTTCIMAAKELSIGEGVRERCSFHYGDFFKSRQNKSESYDLVFWSGSLHHMLDSGFAVMTSFDILKKDGFFYCDEYVGKNRFQFSELELCIANGIRSMLPKEVFNIPGTSKSWNVGKGRVDINFMLKNDPSEAADSENIIPAIKKVFPHAHVIPLGGIVYSLALADILTNIPEDCDLLQQLLRIDDDASGHGLYHYAFTLTPKCL